MGETRQWHTVKDLFHAALDHAPEDRAGFLREACGGDESLFAEIQSLLEAHDACADDHGLSQAQPFALLEHLTAPDSIGPYHLIRKLGAGGMGQVWLAEQTAPLHRTVALKLIRGGLFDDALLSRFQAERQTLALMDHPAIAKVLDAGATPEGQPYFVMEYVAGVAITDYCDQRRLTIPERLAVFIKVCEGVQHAHQKAIIHRDLKPANILVVEIDGVPTPRIIDFGLAKAIASDTSRSVMLTHAGIVVGTPAYMSPEQAESDQLDVDTRTDVYALGVILYELLTGCLPFARDRNLPLDQMLRRLRDEDAPRPSTRIGRDRNDSTMRAEFRHTQPKQLAGMLRGDLDWITMKAVERDRAHRYGSPSELAADIDRHLHHEPVIAGPAALGYRARKYIRRHSVAVGVAALIAVLLTGFAVTEAVQLRRIIQERDRAARERDRANRVTNFMTGMFQLSDPSEARGNSVTAREILDRASAEIDSGLARDPELQAQMMFSMATVYNHLGLYAQSEPLFEKTVSLRTSVFGPGAPDTLDAKLALALTQEHLGLYPQAEAIDRAVLAARQRSVGLLSSDTARTMSDLAVVLSDEGHYAESEKLQRDALDVRRRLLGPDNRDTADSITNLANVLQLEARYPEAEKLDREAVDLRTRILGADHPDTLAVTGNLANVLWRESKYSESESLNRQVLAQRLHLYGQDNPLTLQTMSNLANVLHREGKDAEAEKLARDTLDAQRRILGAEHPETLMSMNNLTAILSKEGRYAEAAKLGEEVLDIRRRVLGPEHPLTLRAMSNLADSMAKLGRWSDAQNLLTQALNIQQRILKPDSPDLALSKYNLACVLAHQGRRKEAFAMLRDAVDHGLAKWIDLDIPNDPDLRILHNDPRFQTLVAYAKSQANVPAAVRSQRPK